MPLSSAQIAQMNGSFMSQHAAAMQYSSMIGAHAHGMAKEGLAARGMNVAAGVGAPIAALGMGMMGLDPLSIGLRSGMAAMGGGVGFGGAAAIGVGAALPMMGTVAAAGYMGNQMMSGAQQSQMFNQDMRSGYSFFNPYGTHGRGFSESHIRDIGGTLRGMAGGSIGGQFGGTMQQFELGPSFSELGRMAANMGRMGLADGVRNAREFTEKFREMMKSVQVIAKDMSTTLEEAQKIMASMKGSGIFKGQAQIGSAIRSASVAGGLATSEVTGMMNVGSQISRMYGGTGAQGALGGIRAIEQIGVATQIGALSEEDIYQATGLTGSEGRRAMAQQNMMQTGSFLRSSKGRWLLASLAGKDGRLNQESVADFMAGGMGVGDTRGAAYANLSKVGRANFIRNEGRLRGAVMEEFGGLAPAMAMMGWAQGKGIDIHSMGDREMLFMQRQLGMGRDEADAMVKMARKLPDILAKKRSSREDDILAGERGLRVQNQSLEGVKRRLQAANDKVSNEMQKVGQDILSVATDKLAEWGNKISHTYEEHAIEGIREAHRAALLGGKGGASIMQGMVGGKFIRDLGAGSLPGMAGHREDIGQANYRNRVQDLQFAARMGTAGGMAGDLRSMVSAESSNLKRLYAEGMAGVGGEDRMFSFKQAYGKDTALGARFRGMSAREQAAFMQQMEGEIGLKSGRLSETFQVPGLPQLVGGGEYYTAAQKQEAMGRAMLGLGDGKNSAYQIAGGVLGGMSGAILGPLGIAAGAYLGAKGGAFANTLAEEFRGTSKTARAAGALLDDPEMRRIAFDTLTGAAGSEDRLNVAIANLKGSAAERGGMDKLTEAERGRLGGMESIRVTSEVMKLANARGGTDKLTKQDWDNLVAKRKRDVAAAGGNPDSVTEESIRSLARGVQGAASAQRAEIVEKLSSQVYKTSRQESQALQLGGAAVASDKGGAQVLTLSAEARKRLMASGGASAVSAAEEALAVQNLGLSAGRAGSEEERAALLLRHQGASGDLFSRMASMDVKGLRALGAQMAGTSVGGMASELIMRGQAIEGTKKRRGAAGAIAAQLGVEMSADELKGLKGMSDEAAAAAMASRMGVGDDKEFVNGLRESIAAAGKKGGGIQGGALLQRALEQASPETKKKLEDAAKGRQSPEEKLLDKITESNNYLKAMVEGNKDAKRALDAIKNNTFQAKDSEK